MAADGASRTQYIIMRMVAHEQERMSTSWIDGVHLVSMGVSGIDNLGHYMI